MKKWVEKVRKAEKKLEDKHRDFAKKAEKHYYNDKENIELPIFYSMVQVQRSALYSRPPNPEIRGRSNDVTNSDSKMIAQTLENAISYQIDSRDFHGDAKRAVLDYIVVDMGVCRVRLDVETEIQTDPMGNEMLDEMGEPFEIVSKQEVYLDHWPWERFIYDIGKDWEECEWVCYKHYMTHKEIQNEYQHDLEATDLSEDAYEGKTCVYEIWDKKTRTVIEMLEGKVLRERDDPLQLKDFFDCYKPMISNMRSDKYIPQSEFKQIYRQLDIINVTEERIDGLTKSIKDAGFYDDSLTDLNKLQQAKDGQLIPISGLRTMLGTQGVSNFDGMIAKLPILNQAQVLQILQERRKEAKEQIYEITGLSDIVRGATKASETATAQQIKGQWASIRLQDKQSTINNWLKGILGIYAEVISEHFTGQQLQLMTGKEVTPEMQQIMQSDVLRCYSIDVETDSTIQADESQDKADRMEMINTFLPLLQNILPAVSQNQLPADLGKTILLTAVKGFKYGRALEDMINGLGDNMQQLQGLQQQLEQTNQQTQEMDQGYQQQLAQANQMIQQLQQELGKVDQTENQRKDFETQIEGGKDKAETAKKYAETAKIQQEIGMQQMPINTGMNQPPAF